MKAGFRGRAFMLPYDRAAGDTGPPPNILAHAYPANGLCGSNRAPCPLAQISHVVCREPFALVGLAEGEIVGPPKVARAFAQPPLFNQRRISAFIVSGEWRDLLFG